MIFFTHAINICLTILIVHFSGLNNSIELGGINSLILSI